MQWDSITISSVVAHHVVEDSAMAISTVQWDNTVAWFVQSYGSLYPLSKVVGFFISTPVASMVQFKDARCSTLDAWYILSSNFFVHNLPMAFDTVSDGLVQV